MHLMLAFQVTALALAVATDSNHKEQQHVLDATSDGLLVNQRHRIGYAKASTVGDETLERAFGRDISEFQPWVQSGTRKIERFQEALYNKPGPHRTWSGKESIVVHTMLPHNTSQGTFKVTYLKESKNEFQMLGEGSFKTVYKATIPEGSLPSPNEHVTDVAIGVQREHLTEASKELRLNQQMMEQSPSMTNLLETYGGLHSYEGGKTSFKKGDPACINVTPIALGGDLGSLVSEDAGMNCGSDCWSEFLTFVHLPDHLPLPFVKSLLREILNGVAEAHAAGVVNYDIKPTNIVLMRKFTKNELAGIDPFPTGVLRIMDFGLGGSYEHLHEDYLEGLYVPGTFISIPMHGTPGFMAPEVFPKKGKGSDVLGRRFVRAGLTKVPYAADIWSVGIILHLMLFGAYNEVTDVNDATMMSVRLIQNIVPSDIRKYNEKMIDLRDEARALFGKAARVKRFGDAETSGEDDEGLQADVLKDFFEKMLAFDPMHRATAKDLLQHEWLGGTAVEIGQTQSPPISAALLSAREVLKKARDERARWEMGGDPALPDPALPEAEVFDASDGEEVKRKKQVMGRNSYISTTRGRRPGRFSTERHSTPSERGDF